MLSIYKNNENKTYENSSATYSLENRVISHNNLIEIRNSLANKAIGTSKFTNSEQIVKGSEVNKFIVPTKIEKWSNGLYDLWDIGFKLINASEEYYSMIESIEIKLYKDNRILATRKTSSSGVEELKKDDIFYGGIDGVLSCSFKARECEESTRYWISSAYDFTTPDRAEIRLSIKNKFSKTITTYVSYIDNYNLMREKLRIIK